MQAASAAIGVHVLGEADLGADRHTGAQQLRAFTHADREGKLALLGQVRADGVHRQPSLRVLLQVPRYHLERLVVVATDQPERDPRAARDTIAVGRFLASLDEHEQRRLWGRPLRCELVTVAAPTLEAVRGGVREHLGRLAGEPHQRPRRVLVGPAGGTGAAVGVLLGALEAGLRPRLCVFASAGRVDSHDLLVAHDELVWLSQLGVFEGLARAADDAHTARPDRRTAADWCLLDAVVRLDWTAVTQTRAAASTVAAALVDPPGELPAAEPPGHAGAWEWLRHALQAAVAIRAGRSDPAALQLVAAWAEAATAELVLRAGAPPETGAATTRPGRLAHAYLAGEDDVFVDALGDRRFADVRGLLAALAPLWPRAAAAAAGVPIAETALAPEVRRQLQQALVRAGGDDPATLLLQRMGYPRWPRIPTAATVVALPVGQRSLDHAGAAPMLDALVAELSARGRPVRRCRLVLAATTETGETAEVLARRAEQAGLAQAVVAHGLDIGDYVTSQRRLYEVLAPEAAAGEEVLALCGPGGKALALATVGAAVQAAFDALRAVRVTMLVEQADGTSQLQLTDSSQDQIAARLAHDDTVALVLPALLDRLELTAAQRVLATASPLWQPVADAAADFARLVHAGDGDLAGDAALADRVGLPTASLTVHGLWRARAALSAETAAIDPWRALAAAVAAAHAGWGAQWARPPHGQATPSACAQLWTWHARSPWGGGGWASPPDPQTLATTIIAAAHELRPAAGHDDAAEHALVHHWQWLCHRAAQLHRAAADRRGAGREPGRG